MVGRSIWVANIIVFISSACTLILELIAGRILAPYIGVSLYTWTSIIGVCLAGISIGNYLGGRIADRWASPMTLSIIFFVSSLATLGVLAMTALFAATGLPIQLPLMARIISLTAVIFFLPVLIMGMVTPVVIKLTLVNLQTTGNTVGTIYAFSTVGSVVGTFATGFFLVEAMGTRAIVLAVAIVLLLMAIITGRLWRSAPKAAATTLVVLAVAGALFNFRSDLLTSPCIYESSYFCIRVHDTEIGGKKVRSLVLDHLVHSYTSLEDSTVLGYGYERTYANLTTYLTQEKPALKALFIGGGGYTFPKYLEAVYPQSEIHVLEIDPAVTVAAHDYLGLKQDTRVQTHNGDARYFMMQWKNPPKFDVVYGDAFNDLSVPYHLTTREFNKMVFDIMSDDGVYMVNVIDNYQTGEFVRAFLNTLAEVFPNVYLMSEGEAWIHNSANTWVVVATKKPFDEAGFAQVISAKNSGQISTAVMDSPQLNKYRSEGRRIIISDDYAPVDQLVARLYWEREKS